MSLDPQIQATIDRLLGTLRGALEAGFVSYADEFRRQAQAEIAEVRETSQRQIEDARRAADAQITGLRGAVEELRRRTQQQIESARNSFETELQRARERADGEIEDARRLAQAQVDDVQREADRRLQTLMAELTSKREQLSVKTEELTRTSYELRTISEQLRRQNEELKRRDDELTTVRQELEDARRFVAEADARAALQAAAQAEELIIAQLEKAQSEEDRRLRETLAQATEERAARSRSLLEEIRTLDDARSLGEVLERLAQFAGREVDRAAVMIVKAERLQEWRLIGFGVPRGGTERIEIGIDDSGLAGTAVRESRTTTNLGADGTVLSASRVPPFARGDRERVAAAFPVSVAGAVVAVLYADALRRDTQDPEWRPRLEILTRHASRVLEAITVQHATGMRPVVVQASQGKTGQPLSGSLQ